MKRKGFTLVELLAVIVILAIILVIVVPKTIDVIKTAREDAFISTNKMIENEIGRVNALEVTPQVYTFNDGVMSPDLGITGKLPTTGTIEINSDRQIQIATNDGEFCAIKRFDEDQIKTYECGNNLCNIVQELALTINPNGGTYGDSTSNTVYQILPDGTQVLEDPVRDGYLFTGWSHTCTECFANGTYTMGETKDTLTANWLPYADMYTFDGTSNIVDDDNGVWEIKFLTNGTFTPKVDMDIDVFLVGGGGGGVTSCNTCTGGGGGYTKTAKKVSLTANTTYTITVGNGGTAATTKGLAGGQTSGFGYTAAGGNGAAEENVVGAGNGGSGGGDAWSLGGTDGKNGATTGASSYGIGQGTTTRKFSESDGTLYAQGGSGGFYAPRGLSGAANTGNGAGSSYINVGGTGGSGIAIIRKSVPKCVGNTTKYCFRYSALYTLENPTQDNWKIRFLENGTLLSSAYKIDAFLVGGGGGGESSCYNCSGAGGGYTSTVRDIDLQATSYEIILGEGGTPAGSKGNRGGTTSAFTYTALGGYGGGEISTAGVGNGGSGGGEPSSLGGTDGNNGVNTNGSYGLGQGFGTREFSEFNGVLYSSGGSGGFYSPRGLSGAANTGNGAGSTYVGTGGKGGSGIVVIRKATPNCVGNTTKYCFTYTGYFSIDNPTEDNWKIKFLSSGNFSPKSNMEIDAFLVGGGGGGGSGTGGGGGGGYTKTQTSISLLNTETYAITVGKGGLAGSSYGAGGTGGTTSAFTYTALGGYGGNGWHSSPICKGGNGGSGGGGGYDGSTGGSGGNDGGNGTAGASGSYGTGQGTTTREFGSPTGTIYGSGGGGGNTGAASNGAGIGGTNGIGVSATANTGGGGGGSGSGASHLGGAGGSGIVIIKLK